jgi:hypothetical protein
MRTMYASRNMFEFQELPKGVISSIRIPRIKCRHQEYYDMELLYRLKNKKFFIGVPRLLKEGANPTIRDEHGLTPLHIAAYRGLFKEVRLLINAGADMNAVDIWGRSVLQYAKEGNSKLIFNFLLKSGAVPSIREEPTRTEEIRSNQEIKHMPERKEEIIQTLRLDETHRVDDNVWNIALSCHVFICTMEKNSLKVEYYDDEGTLQQVTTIVELCPTDEQQSYLVELPYEYGWFKIFIEEES